MNLPVRQQWTPEKMAFVQTLLNEFPLYETRETLPSGFYIGMPIFMQDGRLLRVSHSEEPNASGESYGIPPGRITRYAGGEFSAIQSSSSATQIVRASDSPARRSGSVIQRPRRGDKRIKITGITAPYTAATFDSGYMRITGGVVETGLGMTLMIGNNKATESRTATAAEVAASGALSSGDTVYDIEIHVAVPLPVDFDETTDLLIQGNPYACQRWSEPEAHVAEAGIAPAFYTGTPLVPVPMGHYYWNVVGGPATGQLSDGISSSALVNTGIELTPYGYARGGTTTDAAKLGTLSVAATDSNNIPQAFARLFTRTAATYAANAFAPIWIYPK